MMVKVSVIIPTYNRAHCIERALKSVQNQIFQDYEILVCDDASTDGTRDIVSAYAAEDSRIRLLCLSENQGAGAARNLGMEAAQGEYIAFLDSDDEWLPEKLMRQVEVMDVQAPEVGVCFCGGTIIKNGNADRPVRYAPQQSWENDTFRKFILHQIPFLTPTILFRTTCLKRIGLMVPEMRRNEDGEFLLRLLASYSLTVVPDSYAICHLEIKLTAQHYEAVSTAFPYHLRHYGLIRSKVGKCPALRNQCIHVSNVLCAAIRERRWPEARRWLWRRIRCFPLIMPGEWERVFRAVAASWIR